MDLPLLPAPVQCRLASGTFSWDEGLCLEAESALLESAKIALGEWLPDLARPDEVGRSAAKNPVQPPRLVLRIQPDVVSRPEGYRLEITAGGIEIDGADAAGVFYGLATLRQLLPLSRSGVADLLCLTIDDHPRYRWRGIHLDVSRHMFPLEFLRKQIDLLASFKFNSLHLHLTDDQGWRIEMDKYPRLTEVGSRRASTPIPRDRERSDEIPYQGFYTQSELSSLVDYATARFVQIVPEIEMPGHAVAALAAYPHLGCRGDGYEVRTTWGIEDEVFCAGNDEVFRFLEDVLDEVIAIFPAPFVHVGGDECPKTRWSECPKCRARMKAEQLSSEDELQSWFIGKMAEFLDQRGKRLIGWDEIREGHLPEKTAVMSWRGTEGGVEAAKAGHDVVMTPTSHCYFDYCQSEDRDSEPPAFADTLTLKTVLGFDPSIGVPAEFRDRVLGGQGNLWTEYVPTTEHAEYQLYPRAFAMIEALWSPLGPSGRDFAEFVQRLTPQLERLKRGGVNFRSL